MPTRSEILSAAAQAITVDRAATHGNAESNFGLIAAYWSAHLDHPVAAQDVATMMVLFKVARAKGNPGHVDNWLDACGYAALGGEIATKPASPDGLTFEDHMLLRRVAGVTVHADGEFQE